MCSGSNGDTEDMTIYSAGGREVGGYLGNDSF